MSVLLTILSDPFLATILAAKDAGTASNGFADAIRNFIGPIFLLGIGIAAMSFLFQRQMTQFLQFIVLALGIAVLLYFPNVIKNAAGLFQNLF